MLVGRRTLGREPCLFSSSLRANVRPTDLFSLRLCVCVQNMSSLLIAMPAAQKKELGNREVQDVADRCFELVEINFAAAELRSLLQPIEGAACQGAFPELVMTVGSFAGLTIEVQEQLWSAATTLLFLQEHCVLVMHSKVKALHLR